ncbi:MAG: endopeptidase La [Pseudomonadota bacterium]
MITHHQLQHDGGSSLEKNALSDHSSSSGSQDDKKDKTTKKDRDGGAQLLPVLPLRNIVIFPHMVAPLFVGRTKSVGALQEVVSTDKKIFLLAQKNEDEEYPTSKDLYEIGTVGTIIQLLRLPDQTVKVLVEGLHRARLTKLYDGEEFLEAAIEPILDVQKQNKKLQALQRAVLDEFEQYLKLEKKSSSDILEAVSNIEDPSKIADLIAQHLSIKMDEKQTLLEAFNVEKRLEMIMGHMQGEISVLQVEKRIRSRIKKQMERTQREYYLNEQMKAIQKELGDNENGGTNELDELEARIKKTKFTKEAREKANSELKKLRNMSLMSAEASVIRNYLDWMLSIPWNKNSRVSHNLETAQQILDEDHYALEKVKERIIEHLAVLSRVGKMKGPILCLVGPPGVGKTSLGRSVARATNRSFVRMSLGGVRDESEIRGHRRTYIGSLPGRIIQGMKKAKTSNPLFLLDEIDKLGNDWRGDPSSALLEVLDPEQNNSFNDHYLDVDYDLSNVMFIATANSLNMPVALMDRMEIINIPGYTEDEKINIARNYLVPKQIKEHGLKDKEFKLNEAAVRDLIRYYTREAGVRALERTIANLCRKVIKKIVAKEATQIHIKERNLNDLAGVRQYRFGSIESDDLVGVVTGLAWTQVGGQILQVEAVLVPGKGQIIKTGKLGSVMQESIQAAESFVKSQAANFGITRKTLKTRDIHIHVPEGATPKDGPSAGITMVTAIISALTGIAVRRDIAMTGETTLRGRVLPIGGLKEKLLAALRAGIKTVLIPKENEKDLKDIPKKIQESIKIITVSSAKEVLEHALLKPLIPIDDDDDDDNQAMQTGKQSNENDTDIVRH